MNRLTKILVSIVAAIILLVGAALIAIQSQWFQNYVRDKVIATLEDSTGGRVEIGSFKFDPWSLTAKLTNLTLHGTEPTSEAPLAHVALLELRLKLFAGLKKAIDLAYLGLSEPKINLIANSDGTTNIPAPKIKTKPSQTSGLETVIDLAVGEFRIDNGLLVYSKQSSAFSARGTDLNAALAFNSFNSTYTGRLLIDSLLVANGAAPPVQIKVTLPLLIEKDAVSISGGTFTTKASQVLLNAGLRDLNAPKIKVRLNANLAPADFGVANISQHLVADVGAEYNDSNGEIDIQNAQFSLGQSNFEASGALVAGGKTPIQFSGKLALDELSRFLKLNVSRALGVMALRGHARMDAPKDYSLDANINAIGGEAAVSLVVKNLQQLSLNARLSNFAFDESGYATVIGGAVSGQADLKAKGSEGLAAQAGLALSPGRSGVPVSGYIDGVFVGSSKALQLQNSFLQLPHTRIDISGDINKQLSASLVSHNLADFSPLAPALPVTLQGGVARVDASIQGDLSAPRINAVAKVDHFAVRGNSFQQLSVDLIASANSATVQHGILKGALNANFGGAMALRKWKPEPKSVVSADATISGQLAGLADSISGTLNAQTHISGTYGDPLGNANLEVVNGVAYEQPFEKVRGHVDLTHDLITISGVEVDAAGGQLLAQGTLSHPSNSFQIGHAQFHVSSTDIHLAKLAALQKQSPGTDGIVKLTADGSGELQAAAFQPSNVTAELTASSLKVNNQAAGNLVAHAQTSNGNVNYTIASNFAGSSIRLEGATSLFNDHVTKATASIQNLSIEPALSIAGQAGLPLKGVLSLNGNVSGTIAHPDALVDLNLSKAMIYSDPVNSLTAKVHYTSSLIEVSNLNLAAPAGKLNASAHFTHKKDDFKSGQVQVHLVSSDIDLAKVKQFAVSGGLKLDADIAGDLHDQMLLLTNANADVSATSLRAFDKDLGDLHATAKTAQKIVKYELQSNLGHSVLTGSGQTELENNYNTHAKFSFGQVRWSNFAPEKPPFDVLVDGEASVDGPVLKLDELAGRLQLNQVSFDAGTRNRSVHLQTDAPAVLELNHSIVNIEHLRMQDANSYLQASGSLSLKNSQNALGLNLQSDVDLALIQNADRDFTSSGHAILNATVHGSTSKPFVNGRVELNKANVNYVDFSNGFSNGNGVILLNGTTATIQSLTGESGGGKISLSGFAGLTPDNAAFNLRAIATKVRTRYSDTSITSSADISLTGNTYRSTLSGTVTVQRVAYSSSSDVGSLLSSASAPPSTPSAPSPFLSSMRLDLRIVTAPDLRVVSTYSDKLSVSSTLTVSGTAQDPGIVGQVTVTNGQLVFFGNTYTVNTGSINFYNANAIQPILNLSLETLTQGVDVTLGVTGPISNLKLSYRSDPPLSFEQIVQLLATNTTPADPTIAAHQPTPPQQSTSQMGESALLGQAVANPLASRVQRVFGLTQFKIDPSLSGSNGQPSARVTLQQKITSNLTFTYITDVTQTNSEIVRVTLDITPKISAVALRDYNGNVSVELFYKFQKR